MDDLTELLQINDRCSVSKHHSQVTRLGWGVNLQDLNKEREIFIRDSERNGHFGCFGTTRIGKSKLMENIEDGGRLS